MKEKVLISDDVDDCLPEALSSQYEVIYLPEIDQQGVEDLLPELSGIVINSKTTLHKNQLEKAQRLVWLARLGSGMEIIDVEYAQSRDIQVINTPGANANAVSEHALGMLLSLSSKICVGNTSVKAGRWEREAHRGFELEGKTIGIVGFGNTGSRFAQRLSGFDVEILVFDKYKKRLDDSYRYVKTVELMELQNRSDVISFHVPLNDETHHYFNAEFIENCKDGVIVLNSSRGKIVDTRSLIAAMKKKKVKGACLDVFEREHEDALNDLEMKYLRLHESTVLTPHVAGWTIESKKKIALKIIDELTKTGFL